MALKTFVALTLILGWTLLPLPDARCADTLHIPASAIQSGLEDARSLVLRPDSLLIVSETGAGKISGFRVDVASADTPESITMARVLEESGDCKIQEPDGLSWVADTRAAVICQGTGQVYLLDNALRCMRSLSVPPWVPGGHTFMASDVAGNEFGELFVLDGSAQRVYHFDANGAYLQHFILEDMADPTRMIYYDKSLFITDPAEGKVHAITDDGNNLANIGIFPELMRVRIIDGTIWVLSGQAIHLFSITGQHIGNLMPQGPGDAIRDVVGSGDRVFLLTGGSLYFWNLSP